jgi:hypothetical protein
MLSAALLLVGAGCATPTKAPTVVDDATLPVALVVPDGTAIPAGATYELSGPIGCNDQVIMVRAPRQSASGDDVRDSLTALFNILDHHESWQLDALANSRLAVDKIQSRDGVTTEVWLKGTLSSGGACDDPRIKAQVENTIAQFKPKFQVYLNGSDKDWRCFGDQSGTCK